MKFVHRDLVPAASGRRGHNMTEAETNMGETERERGTEIEFRVT